MIWDCTECRFNHYFQHEQYLEGAGAYPNDIAAIRLSSSANVGSIYISTIPMASTGESHEGSTGTISGWGATVGKYKELMHIERLLYIM